MYYLFSLYAVHDDVHRDLLTLIAKFLAHSRCPRSCRFFLGCWIYRVFAKKVL